MKLPYCIECHSLSLLGDYSGCPDHPKVEQIEQRSAYHSFDLRDPTKRIPEQSEQVLADRIRRGQTGV